jgi:chemotaxis methyl-accepting protein methylase
VNERSQSANASASRHELAKIRSFIQERSGTIFGGCNERDFAHRVREHMASKKIAHASDLLFSMRASNLEYDELLDHLLADRTCFFRHPSVFKVLQTRVLREIHQRKFWENPRSLRIWSAGCGAGEEPYSIAMAINDSLEFAGSWNIHILATDVSRSALQRAERGLYPAHALERVPAQQTETCFTRVGNEFLVRPGIRNMVSFAQMNLVRPVYMGRFDVIFCIDVLMYLSPAERAAVVQRFYEYLEGSGYLFVGPDEAMPRTGSRFVASNHEDCVLYQKPIAPKASESVHAAGYAHTKAGREKKA